MTSEQVGTVEIPTHFVQSCSVCARGGKREELEQVNRRAKGKRESGSRLIWCQERGRWRERQRKDAKGAIILFVKYLTLFRMSEREVERERGKMQGVQ